MKTQLQTIRAGLETATCYPMMGVDAHSVQTALTALSELERMVGEPWLDERGYTLDPLHAAAPPAQQPQAEAVPSNCRERLMSEGKPYPRSSCAVCGKLSPNWKKCNASIAAMKQGNQP